MISIKETFDTVQSLAQKQQHGTVTIPEFEKYANLASMDLYNEKVGPTRDYYKLGKATSKIAPGMNKQVESMLNPFRVSDFTVPLIVGVGPLPDGIDFIESVSAGGAPVTWIPGFKLPSYLRNTIDKPTVEYPLYVDRGDKIEVHPTEITSVNVSYYKLPATVKYAFTVDTVNRRRVYKEEGSVHFEWSPTEKAQLIFRICSYIGLSIRDSELQQVSEQQKNTSA